MVTPSVGAVILASFTREKHEKKEAIAYEYIIFKMILRRARIGREQAVPVYETLQFLISSLDKTVVIL